MKRYVSKNLARKKNRPCPPPTTSEAPENTSRDEYLKTRSDYSNLSTNQSNLLDKSILTVSGVTLAFSLTYIDKIAPLNNAQFPLLIVSAWICLSVSCAFTIISLHAAYKCTCSYINQYDNNYKNNETGNKLTSRWETLTSLSNNFSLVLFITGLILLIAFSTLNIFSQTKSSTINIKEENEMIGKDTQILTEGRGPQQPPVLPQSDRGSVPMQPPVQTPKQTPSPSSKK